jgi:hypothetical protein
MKIIAVIPAHYGNKKFLLEATEREIAKLIGHAYEGDCRDKMEVGADIKIASMFDQLRRLADAQEELKKASTTIHSIANLVHIIDPMIEAVIKEPEEEDKQC